MASIALTSLALVSAVVLLYSASLPGGYFDFLLLGLACWSVTGVIWLILLFTRRRSLFLLIPCAVAAATFALLVTDSAFWIGFKISESALTHHAKTKKEGWAGLYYVEEPTEGQNQILLPLRDAGFLLTEYGFLYAPGGVSNGYGEEDVQLTTYERIEGPWYWYSIED